MVNLALALFHDGFPWSSLNSEFCRQVENHCPACHPSHTFTILVMQQVNGPFNKIKGFTTPLSLLASDAIQQRIQMSIFISGSWEAYSVLNAVCSPRKSFLCFSKSKSLEDLIKSSELLLSIKDVTFISRLFLA